MPESMRKSAGSRHKIVSVFLALFLAGTVLLFDYFAAGETVHECCGENCPVCALLLQYETTILPMSSDLDGIVVRLSIFWLICIRIQKAVPRVETSDLVTWKVRLNP